MKHVYLIIAHNNFGTLQKLIYALDDFRNDIILHIDKKVKNIPDFIVKNSRLYIINKRINISWGHVSQIEAEFLLFEYAYNLGDYDYYHLISGTHFPIKSQDAIHYYFESLNGKSIMSSLSWSHEEINRKIGLNHYFLRNCGSTIKIIKRISNILWRLSLKCQKCDYKKTRSLFKGKVTNWVSISKFDMKSLLENKSAIIKPFKHTLCSDELFLPYAFDLMKRDFIDYDKYLFQHFNMASPKQITKSDLINVLSSDCLFARKFMDTDTEIMDKILEYIK